MVLVCADVPNRTTDLSLSNGCPKRGEVTGRRHARSLKLLVSKNIFALTCTFGGCVSGVHHQVEPRKSLLIYSKES